MRAPDHPCNRSTSVCTAQLACDMLPDIRSHGYLHRRSLPRRRLRLRLRAQNPGAQLIWYDAVTIDGALRWQDTLNAANRPFFEDCDGIFVNYTWKVRHMRSRSSLEILKFRDMSAVR